MNEHVVVVGAGQSGGEAVKALRQEGFQGEITLIGNEAHFPYERPPLSKSILSGEAEVDSCLLSDADTFQSLHINFLNNTTVKHIDCASKTITTDSDEEITYTYLILATGGHARTLNIDGSDNEGIFYLRSIEDSLAIRQKLQPGKKMVIIGGGWIGLEVASTARKKQLDVTVVEFADRLCGRVVPSEMSDYLFQLHESNSVKILLQAAANNINRNGDTLSLDLKNGEKLEADCIVVGIGLIPNTQLAEAAGLAIDNGIKVNAEGETEDSSIFAIGDVANYRSHSLNRNIRLESWANARAMASACAKKICGQTAEQNEYPWFWSDQYNANIQMLGIPEKWGKPILRGDIKQNQFSWFYINGNKLEAMISINAAKDVAVGRRLIQKGIHVSANELADQTISLNKLLKK